MKEGNLKLAAIVEKYEKMIEQYEESLAKSKKYGEEQLKGMR